MMLELTLFDDWDYLISEAERLIEEMGQRRMAHSPMIDLEIELSRVRDRICIVHHEQKCICQPCHLCGSRGVIRRLPTVGFGWREALLCNICFGKIEDIHGHCTVIERQYDRRTAANIEYNDRRKLGLG